MSWERDRLAVFPKHSAQKAGEGWGETSHCRVCSLVGLAASGTHLLSFSWVSKQLLLLLRDSECGPKILLMWVAVETVTEVLEGAVVEQDNLELRKRVSEEK